MRNIHVTCNLQDAEKLEFTKVTLDNKKTAGIISTKKLTPDERRARARKAMLASELINKVKKS